MKAHRALEAPRSARPVPLARMLSRSLWSVVWWQVGSGYCLQCWDVGAKVAKVEWNPNPSHHVVAVAAGSSVFLIATNTGQ